MIPELPEHLKGLLLKVYKIQSQAQNEPFDPPYEFSEEDKGGLEDLEYLGLIAMVSTPDQPRGFRVVSLTDAGRSLVSLLGGDRTN